MTDARPAIVPPTSWTDERTDLLKSLWAKGLSAPQIAKQLGGVTRNAVIGKVHRLGLSGRGAPSKPARTVFKAPRRDRPSKPLIAGGAVYTHAEPRCPRELVPERDEAPGRCTILSLTARTCRWPIGDPASPAFSFCGAPKDAEAGPYCAAHAKIAYRPPKTSAKELARSLRRLV